MEDRTENDHNEEDSLENYPLKFERDDREVTENVPLVDNHTEKQPGVIQNHPSAPDHYLLSENESALDEKSAFGWGSGTADEDNVTGMGDGVCEAEEGLPGMGQCSSVEMGDNITGLVDCIIADMSPTVMDLRNIPMASRSYSVDSSHKDGSNATEMVKREAINTAGMEKSGNKGIEHCHGRYSEEGDNDHNQPSPRLGQPPNGPFVVGNQMDIMTEMYSRKLTSDSTSASLGSPQTENSVSSPSGLEPSPFFGRSMIDAFKWHSAGIPGFSDRRVFKKLTDCSMPRQQKVRTDLTLADKVRLINVSETTGRSQRSLAAEFHISVGSVNNILRRKREYKEAFERKDTASSSSKITRCYRPVKVPPVNELQRLINLWVDIAKVKVKPLTWTMVLDKAREFTTKLKVVNQNLSMAWLETCLQSMDLPLQVASAGIRAEKDSSLLDMWQKMLPFLVQGYQPENIFTVTETTLYYKCLPDCCYVGGPTCQNFNRHMNMLEPRLTVLLCCNILGERLKPMVISRHACPPSMRSVAVADLPVVWCHQSSAAITAEIFAGWLRSLEASMAQQGRHIALFMEMTPSHLSAMLLKHVSLKFYLDDSAHLLQPLNHGIVRHFKAYFRRRLLQTAMAQHSSAGESVVCDRGEQAVRAVTELDAVFWIQDAWRTVSLDTIRTSFHKAGFPQTSRPSLVCLPEARIEPLPSDFLHLVQEAGRTFRFTPMDATLYAEFDSQLPCHSTDMEDWEKALLAEATVDHMPGIKQEPGTFDELGAASCSFQSSMKGRSQDGSEKAVKPSEALESLSTLKRFSANNIGLLTTVFELETVLLDSISPAAHP